MTTESTPTSQPALRRRSLGAYRDAMVASVAAFCAALGFGLYGLGGRAVVGALFCGALVVLAAIDFERHMLPNRIVIPTAVAVAVLQVALFPDRALEWIAAALATALFLLLTLVFYRGGIGMGDVKLGLLLGAGLGAGVVPALVVGFFSAAAASIVVLVHGGLAARKTEIPFGPFLALGGILAFFLAPHLPGGTLFS